MCPSEPAEPASEQPADVLADDVVEDVQLLVEDGVPVPRKAGRPDARTRRDLLTGTLGCFLLMLSLLLLGYVGVQALARVLEK